MQQITDFIVENLKSMGFAVLYLIAGLIFLPDSFVLFILKRLKKGVVRKVKEPNLKLVNTVANLYIKGDVVDLQETDNTFNNKTKYLLEQNEKIDKNIYVIDLCKDIVKTLGFVVPRSRGVGMYDATFEYLVYYSRLIVSLDQHKSFYDDMCDKIDELNDLFSTKETNTCESENAQNRLSSVNQFFDYMKTEKEKLEKLKNKNKEELIKLLKAKIDG